MSDYNREKQLKCLHRQRRAATDQRANDAIDHLLRAKKPVNFKQVSQQSGISIATLYKHETIKQRIIALRSNSEISAFTKAAKQTMSNSSKDAIIASLKRKIEKLKRENAQLRNQLKTYTAKDWENL